MAFWEAVRLLAFDMEGGLLPGFSLAPDRRAAPYRNPSMMPSTGVPCELLRTPSPRTSENNPSTQCSEYALAVKGIPNHLPGGIALQALGCGVRPTAQTPDAALRRGEQVPPVHPDRRAAREAEPPCLLLGVDGDQFHV